MIKMNHVKQKRKGRTVAHKTMALLLAMLLMVTSAGATTYASVTSNPPEAPNLDTASTWAHEGINRAFAYGLIPQNLQSQYTYATTRAEFAAFAVTLYELVTGREITVRETFNDTTDINVEKIAGLGVVTGVGDGNFAPDNTITREQAAVMLARLSIAIEQPLPSSNWSIRDRAEISSWAVDSVNQMLSAHLISQIQIDSQWHFDPSGEFTREQSITAMLRLYDIVFNYLLIENTLRRIDTTIHVQLSSPDGVIVYIVELQQLPHLTSLRISSGMEDDVIAALLYLPDITHLYLQITFDKLPDFTPLADLPNLTHLWVNHFVFHDFDLSLLTSLTSFEISNIQYEELYLLSYIPNLTHLWLGRNMLSAFYDFLPLGYIENLTSLTLSGGFPSYQTIGRDFDYSSLATLTNLQTLGVWYLEVEGLAAIGYYLPQLIDLRMWNARIDDLSPILKLANLEVLHVFLDRVHTAYFDVGAICISPLASLQNLTSLVLHGANLFVDITPLEELTNLKHLFLGNMWHDSQLTDISPLAGLTNLEELHFVTYMYRYIDLTQLEQLINLTWLSIFNQQIRCGDTGFLIWPTFDLDLTPLAGLTNLTELGLFGNGGISDWSPVDHVEFVLERDGGFPSGW